MLGISGVSGFRALGFRVGELQFQPFQGLGVYRVFFVRM